MGSAATTEVTSHASARDAVLDLAFEVRGSSLPLDHRHALRDAIMSTLAWLESEPAVAIHPLKSARGDDGRLLLSARSRLVLRVPADRRESAAELDGRVLQMGASRVTVGTATPRPLLAHGTVYAHLVSGNIDDEVGFTAAMQDELETLGIRGEVICGRRQSIGAGDTLLRGFSVMVHGLAPEASLRLQARGTGCDMKLGCGIFVPHRSAAAVGS
jgi:CRISPR-associated protein Cas6